MYLFKNGFRISPYGDAGNDWLGLEIRKGQGQRRYLGTRDIIGRIEINDTGGDFRDVSSREGLVENTAFLELTNDKTGYSITILKRLEKYVVKALHWDSIPEEEKKILSKIQKTKEWELLPEERYKETDAEKENRALENITSLIGLKKNVKKLYINTSLLDRLSKQEDEKIRKIFKDLSRYESASLDRKTLGSLKKLRDIIKKKDEDLKKAKDRVSDQEEEIKGLGRENIFLKSISLQDKEQIISLFHHIGIHSDTIKTNSGRLLKNILEIKGIPDSVYKQAESISKLAQMINTISKIGYKGGITEQMERGKQDIIQFMSEFIQNICREYYDTIDIQIDDKIKKKYVKEFAPFELTYVIDNLISNSKKQNAKRIIFKFFEKDAAAIIEVIDNGDGLSPKIKDIENIFGRTVSTTRGGAGLGLYDARKILSKIKAKISAESLEDGFKIKIVIPNEN